MFQMQRAHACTKEPAVSWSAPSAAYKGPPDCIVGRKESPVGSNLALPCPLPHRGKWHRILDLPSHTGLLLAFGLKQQIKAARTFLHHGGW